MVKRRKARARAYFGRKTRSRSRSSGSRAGWGGLLAAALYGAGRGFIAAKIEPLTSKIPLGSLSDNVGMIGVNWALNKYVGNKIPMIKQATSAGLMIEAAMIGAELAQKGFSATQDSATTTSYVYG